MKLDRPVAHAQYAVLQIAVEDVSHLVAASGEGTERKMDREVSRVMGNVQVLIGQHLPATAKEMTERQLLTFLKAALEMFVKEPEVKLK